MEPPTPQGTIPPSSPDPETTEPAGLDASLTRRGFLRGAALAGTGLVAATVAACAPAAAPVWEYATSKPQPAPTTPPATPVPSETPGMTMAPTPTAAPSGPAVEIPAGWSEHDVNARNVVRRYVGNLAPALKDIYGEEVFAQLADILGAADNYPELSQPPAWAQVPQLVVQDMPLRWAAARRRRQGLRADDRRDRAADRREDGPRSRRSATTSSGRAPRSASPRATRCGSSSRTT